MKKLTEKEALLKMTQHLQQYDLYDLLPKLYARHLTEKTGVHFSEDGKLYGTNFSASPDKNGLKHVTVDPDQLAEKCIDNLIKTYGENYREDLKIFQDTRTLFDSYHFRIEKAGQYTMRAEYGGSMLAYVLEYVINGILHPDLSFTNQAWTYKTQYGGNGNKLDTVGTHTSDVYPNVTIKRYQNGRADIKGLTAQQYDKIQELYDLYERISKTQQK